MPVITSNYRGTARRLVESAKTHLASGNDDVLRYAALDLRMAMEALTYDRAKAYKAELPPSGFDRWQPSKVMQLLIDIDPLAGESSTIAFGIEEEYGVPAPVMKTIGTDKVLKMTYLRKHYNALGSFLHLPTIKQLDNGKGFDAAKCRKLCEGILAILEDILSTHVFNVTIGNFAEIECMRCGKPVRKRIPHDAKSVDVQCYECGAEYKLEEISGDQVAWKPRQDMLPCAKEGCGHKIVIWSDEQRIGTYWTCPACQSRNRLALGIFIEEEGVLSDKGLVPDGDGD
jgi:DNA-directed RNA polymerase subunit RPC12/RpoP